MPPSGVLLAGVAVAPDPSASGGGSGDSVSAEFGGTKLVCCLFCACRIVAAGDRDWARQECLRLAASEVRDAATVIARWRKDVNDPPGGTEKLGADAAAQADGGLTPAFAIEVISDVVPASTAPRVTCSLCFGICDAFVRGVDSTTSATENPWVSELVKELRDWNVVPRDAESSDSFLPEFLTFRLVLELPAATAIRFRCAVLWLWELTGVGLPKASSGPMIVESVELKDAIRWLATFLVTDTYTDGKLTFDPDSDFDVRLSFAHIPTNVETELLVKAVSSDQKRQVKNKYGRDPTSNGTLKTLLFRATSLSALVEAGLPCPPRPLKMTFTSEDITFSARCAHAAILVGGRYLKHSTHCSQSPWLILGSNERVTSTSVQELLTDPLRELFGEFSDVKMQSSGREDQDVRMLGDGRPFIVEIANPRKLRRAMKLMLTPASGISHSAESDTIGEVRVSETEFSRECSRLIVENPANRLGTEVMLESSLDETRTSVSSGKVDADMDDVDLTVFPTTLTAQLRRAAQSPIAEGLRMCLLQKHHRDILREGEAEKRKLYRALVWFERPVRRDDVDVAALRKYQDEEIVVQQMTPVRVLHRRNLAVRPRTVHSLRMELIFDEEQQQETQYAFIELTTQAGTYIKEFVHGDLGRTSPSLGEFMHCHCDILQLDVVQIDLEFPPEKIDRKPLEIALGLEQVRTT